MDGFFERKETFFFRKIFVKLLSERLHAQAEFFPFRPVGELNHLSVGFAEIVCAGMLIEWADSRAILRYRRIHEVSVDLDGFALPYLLSHKIIVRILHRG